ncbi:MAG: putative RNA-binding protein containing Zn ribbon [Deltaproteobacteria bacterium]|nr:putative RNA-binding protein containing Zn ribbon [Deltaproteobacteria bacterium]
MISTLGEILGTLPVKERVKEYGLWKVWDKLAGEAVSRHCQPDRLKDGILFLKVDSPVWMQQLQFMKSLILEKVNVYMKENAVKDVRFQIGKLGQTRKGKFRPWKDVYLPQEVVLRLDNELSSVRDPELRDIIKKVRIKEAQVKAWKDQRQKGGSSSNSPA